MSGEYSSIVVDPPWDYSNDPPRFSWSEHGGAKVELPPPYPPLTLDEIRALPVADLAATNAHLYLWTTQRYIRAAFIALDSWRFRYVKTLVWAKNPRGFGVGGAFGGATEFVIFARRGRLPATGSVNRDHFDWPRNANRHSAKPEAFYDLVEYCSPGPYLELFARRNRLGWDTWGDEALEHVEMAIA